MYIKRIKDGRVRGSSRPVIAQTDTGLYLIKLKGAAQGCGVLISEIVVSRLAQALNLPVLPWIPALLPPDVTTEDKNDELADLLAASTGLNLAFPLLEHARDADCNDFSRFTAGERASVLWLDRLVMNPDRTDQNPNILYQDGNLFLIDHGAALRFQYDWTKVTEQMPSTPGTAGLPHLFEEEGNSNAWPYWETLFAECITRNVIEEAVGAVPDEFILSMLPESFRNSDAGTQQIQIHRRRAAYVAFLWKRLKPPRWFAFVKQGLKGIWCAKGRPHNATTTAEEGVNRNNNFCI